MIYLFYFLTFSIFLTFGSEDVQDFSAGICLVVFLLAVIWGYLAVLKHVKSGGVVGVVHEGLWPGSVAGGKGPVHGGCIQSNPALP